MRLGVRKYDDTKRLGSPKIGVYMGPEYVEDECDLDETGDTDELDLDDNDGYDADTDPDNYSEPNDDDYDDDYDDAVEDNWTGTFSRPLYGYGSRRRELSHDEIAREEYAFAIGAR